ncbi:hypothetical protein SNR37_003043 [Agarivorans aestuarii]|uniref:Uncharacterized protein n=1 Tax=Agarivorans aestuarii TaxID=1563703 RepID=A0ABU7G2K1_9ALTE|nr:hypothetical protein [Agarivorans aestuarii]MEE1673617.1 hypothetical protein [Agarivorans aestuarii]
MNPYLVYSSLLMVLLVLIFFVWNKLISDSVKSDLKSWFESLKPSVQCHIKTSVQLAITLFFSLLPAILASMSKGSQSVNWLEILISDLKDGSVFVYTPAFLAQFFILTFTHEFKNSDGINFIYKIVLLFSFYACFMGAMTYAGFIDRGVFNFGDETLALPSTVDWSVIFTTLLSWYYCTYKVTYVPKSMKKTYKEQDERANQKFDEVMNHAKN